MKVINGRDLLKISEVEKATGVPASTIHYYMQQGLLTPLVKTARNMAYYNPVCIQEIRLIQELQAKQYLPLSLIKLILKAKQEGQSTDHLFEMQSSMEEIFQPLGNLTVPCNLTLIELVSASGLDESEIKTLEAMELIQPHKTEHGLRYDDADLRLAQLFKKLAGFGLRPSDLDIYRQYIKMMRLEARAVHRVFHKLPDHEKIPIREVFWTLKEFKGCLETRIYRDEAGKFGKHAFNAGSQK